MYKAIKKIINDTMTKAQTNVQRLNKTEKHIYLRIKDQMT